MEMMATMIKKKKGIGDATKSCHQGPKKPYHVWFMMSYPRFLHGKFNEVHLNY